MAYKKSMGLRDCALWLGSMMQRLMAGENHPWLIRYYGEGTVARFNESIGDRDQPHVEAMTPCGSSNYSDCSMII